MRCKQELCQHWSGDGNVCPCALFNLDTAVDPFVFDEDFELEAPAVDD